MRDGFLESELRPIGRSRTDSSLRLTSHGYWLSMIGSCATSIRSRDAHSLPEHPLVSIRPSGKWSALNLRDLWSYRELLYFLTWRDVKVRYKQTLLGATWAIIQPLFAML